MAAPRRLLRTLSPDVEPGCNVAACHRAGVGRRLAERARPRSGARSGRRALPYGLLACIALAALTPARAVGADLRPVGLDRLGPRDLDLDLKTTAGPSWKPLPVAFTTVFALFGSAAPTLWMLVARAGALYGGLAAFRLGRRLGADRQAGSARGRG